MAKASNKRQNPFRTKRNKGLALVVALGILAILNSSAYAFPISLLNYFGTGAMTRINLISYAPEVWLSLLALVFGTLIIVISIASESTPKLIDLFVGDYKSRLFIWLITLSSFENIFLQLIHTRQTVYLDNLIFLNNYLLLPSFVILSIPYIFYILKYTKNSNVIDKIYDENRRTIRAARSLNNSRQEIDENQYVLFETINQLHDLLQHVRFKEPKADIIHKFGKSLRFYINKKSLFPNTYFYLGIDIKSDISFRTLTEKFPQVEVERTFYEHKVLRIIGTSYLLLIQDGHSDLASLCGNELCETGKAASEATDKHAVGAVLLHFNTLLRHGINHGLKTREIKNVYNTIFHYSEFIDFLIKKKEVDRIVECCKYFAFYGNEVGRLAQSESSFLFLIDAFAISLKKFLITLYDNKLPRDLQLMVLKAFNELNTQEDGGALRRRTSHRGFRLAQIGLCLYYIETGEQQFSEITIECMIRDLNGMDADTAKSVIVADCDRINGEFEEFWEDTDQGNRNMFYTPLKNQLPTFKSYFFFKLSHS